MSKAEERALKAYPVFMTTLIPADDEHPLIEQDCNTFTREAYIKGYRQAEKDLELSWEDMKLIYGISCDVFNEQDGCFYDVSKVWEKVLKRFKNYKERKER